MSSSWSTLYIKGVSTSKGGVCHYPLVWFRREGSFLHSTRLYFTKKRGQTIHYSTLLVEGHVHALKGWGVIAPLCGVKGGMPTVFCCTLS